MIAQHHWPVWGNERVREVICDQRDMYKYLHDEVLRLANLGYTIFEIPEIIELPEALAKKWHNRDYYAHPPVEGAKRFVALGGGSAAILEKLQDSFDEGDYRWVAEVANKLVFADPSDRAARARSMRR